jgi:hypothetical protein|tara:strand:+ start:133 stop:537 length:405 start_codon:yes stop_codon:yes gene_type:complete
LNLNRERRNLLNNWKAWLRSSEIAVVVETSIGIFFDLFGSLEVTVEGISIVILAVDGGVILADLWASFVNAAAVVLSKMFTGTVNQEKPIVVFREHGGIFMQQIPADVAKRLGSFRAINGKGKILTAFGRAMIA